MLPHRRSHNYYVKEFTTNHIARSLRTETMPCIFLASISVIAMDTQRHWLISGHVKSYCHLPSMLTLQTLNTREKCRKPHAIADPPCLAKLQSLQVSLLDTQPNARASWYLEEVLLKLPLSFHTAKTSWSCPNWFWKGWGQKNF